MDFSVFDGYFYVFFRGIIYTLFVSFSSVFIGIMLTVVLFLGLKICTPKIELMVSLISEFIRICPPLVVLIWIYYAMPAAGLPAFSPLISCILALSLYFAVFGVDILRSAFNAIPSELFDSEMTLSKNKFNFFIRFILPDLWRRTFPAMNAQVVSALKNSSLAMIIGVPELTYTASMVAIDIVRPFEVYTVLAFCYIITIVPVIFFLRWLEKTRWVALEPGRNVTG